MTRMTTMHDERERQAFAQRAADHFANNPKHWTYSNEEGPTPGALFALRWGLGQDCVVVFRISDDEPVNYQNIINRSNAP